MRDMELRKVTLPGLRLSFIVLSAALFLGFRAAPTGAEPLDTSRFIEGAFLKYETVFTLPTSRGRFTRMLDDLFLMGALWDAYGFSPHYRVNRLGVAYHVIDPTGIEGVLRTVEAGTGERTLLADGRLKHWYIPLTLTGRALFLIRYTEAPGGITVRFTVYGEGNPNWLEQAFLKAIAPFLSRHIDHRVARNLRDFRTIVADLETNPGELDRKLNCGFRAELDRLLDPRPPQ